MEGQRGAELILLYSGGLDSTYIYAELLKRGVSVAPLHAYTSRPILRVAVENLRRVSGRPVTLYVSNHADLLRAVVRRLRRLRAEHLTCVACKVLMLLEAQRLADILGAEGIVTGEILGQVASQTLPNMLLVHGFVEKPVYTPLLALDKHEASNLIAHVLVKTPPCPFLPRRPATRPDPVEARMVLEEAGIRELAEAAYYERVVV